MADESVLDLVLGFFGDQPVAPANAAALLGDFISAHKKQYRSASIRFVVPVEPFTETLEELAELCLAQGHKLELIGHARALDDQKVQRYAEDADLVIEVPKEMRTAAALIERLHEPLNGRLILLAEPSEDEDAYLAFEKSVEKFITVRSLLNGLDMVIPAEPTTENDKEQTDVVKRARDEEPEDEEFEDEEDDVEDDDEDLEDEEDEEEESDEDDDDLEDEEEDEDDDLEDEDDDEDSDDDDEEDDEEEPAPRRRAAKKAPVKTAPAKRSTSTKSAPSKKSSTSSPKKYTKAQLDEMDRDELYDVAGEFGIGPAKGRKMATVINLILEAQDPDAAPAAPVVKKTATSKAPAKKTPLTKRPAATSETEPEGDGVTAALISTGFGLERVVKITMKHVGQALIDASEEL